MSQIKNERDGNIENMQESLRSPMIFKIKESKDFSPPHQSFQLLFTVSILVPLFVTFAGPS